MINGSYSVSPPTTGQTRTKLQSRAVACVGCHCAQPTSTGVRRASEEDLGRRSVSLVLTILTSPCIGSLIRTLIGAGAGNMTSAWGCWGNLKVACRPVDQTNFSVGCATEPGHECVCRVSRYEGCAWPKPSTTGWGSVCGAAWPRERRALLHQRPDVVFWRRALERALDSEGEVHGRAEGRTAYRCGGMRVQNPMGARSRCASVVNGVVPAVPGVYLSRPRLTQGVACGPAGRTGAEGGPAVAAHGQLRLREIC